MAKTRSGKSTAGRNPNPGRNKRSYKAGDKCHRHRKPDTKPYTVAVTTYQRRKPKK